MAGVPGASSLPPLEKGRVGAGIAGRTQGVCGLSAAPLPTPPPGEAGGSRRERDVIEGRGCCARSIFRHG
jgi:hypothetical protein